MTKSCGGSVPGGGGSCVGQRDDLGDLGAGVEVADPLGVDAAGEGDGLGDQLAGGGQVGGEGNRLGVVADDGQLRRHLIGQERDRFVIGGVGDLGDVDEEAGAVAGVFDRAVDVDVTVAQPLVALDQVDQVLGVALGGGEAVAARSLLVVPGRGH